VTIEQPKGLSLRIISSFGASVLLHDIRQTEKKNGREGAKSEKTRKIKFIESGNKNKIKIKQDKEKQKSLL